MNLVSVTEDLNVLVAIASYGEKNLGCLQRVIRRYQTMSMKVDLVVVAESEKSADLGVPVIVGTPTRNPHSLPFAHKQALAEKVDQYDLYIYSEDDIDVSEANIRAFVELSRVLTPDEVAGYIRYEESPDGVRFLPDVHGRFRWKPRSVERRGDFVVAEFTNEHAGFYILTNDQLKRAIASGGFLSAPHEGRYGMLESAATDVYVQCGFRKVICISELDRFLVHHMPNRYVGQMGISLSLFREQLQTLARIHAGAHPASTLCEVEPRVLESKLGKRYDERPSQELLALVPTSARSVLTIGSGFAAMEHTLLGRGLNITTFPLDSIVGAASTRTGMEVVHGTLEECFNGVRGRQFDCVIMTNLVHLLPNPMGVIGQCAELLGKGGTLILQGQNFDCLPILVRRLVGASGYRQLRRFSESGVHAWGIRSVKNAIRRAGLRVNSLRWCGPFSPAALGNLGRYSRRFGATAWLIQAERA